MDSPPDPGHLNLSVVQRLVDVVGEISGVASWSVLDRRCEAIPGDLLDDQEVLGGGLDAASCGASSSIRRTDDAISSFSSALIIVWSYVLSISALRQPRSSTSASRACSRSAGVEKSSRTFLTRKWYGGGESCAA